MPLTARGCGQRHACNQDRSTARPAAGAATAAAAQRVGRGDGEPGTITGLDEIHLDRAATAKQFLIHQEFQAAFVKSLVTVFWLIQSQSKGRTASPTLHQGDANGRTDLILLQVCFQIIDSKRCDLKHSCLLKMERFLPCWLERKGYGGKIRCPGMQVNRQSERAPSRNKTNKIPENRRLAKARSPAIVKNQAQADSKIGPGRIGPGHPTRLRRHPPARQTHKKRP